MPSDPSLLGYYPFDDDPNDGVDNSVPGVPDAVCRVSCPSQVPGVHGGAYRFDGVDDLVEIADRPDLRFTAGTLALWLRLDRLPAIDTNMSLLGKALGSGVANSYEIWVADVSIGTRLRGGGDADPGASARVEIDAPWTSGIDQWVHLAITYGVETRLYMGGVRVGQDNPLQHAYDGHSVLIGGDSNNDTVDQWTAGAIDEVYLFARQLDDAEIAALAR